MVGYAFTGLPVMRYLVDQGGFDLNLRDYVSCGVYMTLCMFTPMHSCFVRRDAGHY